MQRYHVPLNVVVLHSEVNLQPDEVDGVFTLSRPMYCLMLPAVSSIPFRLHNPNASSRRLLSSDAN